MPRGTCSVCDGTGTNQYTGELCAACEHERRHREDPDGIDTRECQGIGCPHGDR